MYYSDLTKDNTDFGDTTLRLDSFGYGTGRENKRPKSDRANSSRLCDVNDNDSCDLVLGPAASTHSKGSRSDSILQLGPPGGTEVVSQEGTTHNPCKRIRAQMINDDEGSNSTSIKRYGCYLKNLILAPPNKPISKPYSSPVSMFEPGSTQTTTTAASSYTAKSLNDGSKESRLLFFARRNPEGGPGNLFRGSMVKGNLGRTSSSLSVVSDSYISYDRPIKRRRGGGLIPPQVLVPSSMKASKASGGGEVSGPEGRVHGGAFLSLLRRGEGDDLIGNSKIEDGLWR